MDEDKVKATPASSSAVNPIEYGTNLRITVAANQGGRRYMEDRVHIETYRNVDGSIRFTFLGVFDGHGGAEASEYVRRHLLDNIMKNPQFDSLDDNDILEAIRIGFLVTHEQMWKIFDTWPRTASGYPSTAGTTSSVAIIREGKLYTGHVGDSAIFIGCRGENDDSELITERVTFDHKPESEEERARIQSSGGSVANKSGVNRVVWTRPLKGHVGPVRRSTPTENIPFLAVARSLGDLWSYCEATKSFIVSPDPDLCVRELTEDDMCMVLVSDGITNVMAPLQITMVVNEEEKITSSGMSNHERLNREKHTNHARALVATGLRNWRNLRADNVSAICVLFDSPDSKLADNAVSVEETLAADESVDETFAIDPECMIRVSPEATQKLATYRIPLLYGGALDNNFTSVDYRGPGFITHDEEEEIEAKFHLRERQDEEKLVSSVVYEELEASVVTNKGFYEELEVMAESSVVSTTGQENVPFILCTPEKSVPQMKAMRSSSRASAKRQATPSAKLDQSRMSAKVMREEMNPTTSSGDSAVTSASPSTTNDALSIAPVWERSDEEDSAPNEITGPEEGCSPGLSKGRRKTRSTKAHSTSAENSSKASTALTTPSKTVSTTTQMRVTRSACKLVIGTSTPSSKTMTTDFLKPMTSPRTRGHKKIIKTPTRTDGRLQSPVSSRTRREGKLDPSTSGCITPKTKTVPVESLTGLASSRKRPRSIEHVGVTPVVERLSLSSPVTLRTSAVFTSSSSRLLRSAPSTPSKVMVTPPAHSSSQWSLSKIEMRSTMLQESMDGEPPSKMRRIVGFVRKLVGLDAE